MPTPPSGREHEAGGLGEEALEPLVAPSTPMLSTPCPTTPGCSTSGWHPHEVEPGSRQLVPQTGRTPAAPRRRSSLPVHPDEQEALSRPVAPRPARGGRSPRPPRGPSPASPVVVDHRRRRPSGSSGSRHGLVVGAPLARRRARMPRGQQVPAGVRLRSASAQRSCPRRWPPARRPGACSRYRSGRSRRPADARAARRAS